MWDHAGVSATAGDRYVLKGSPGRIINITSVGGKYGAPFMSAYSASKHAVEGLSDSLRRELIPYGIDVIVVGTPRLCTPATLTSPACPLPNYSPQKQSQIIPQRQSFQKNAWICHR